MHTKHKVANLISFLASIFYKHKGPKAGILSWLMLNEPLLTSSNSAIHSICFSKVPSKFTKVIRVSSLFILLQNQAISSQVLASDPFDIELWKDLNIIISVNGVMHLSWYAIQVQAITPKPEVFTLKKSQPERRNKVFWNLWSHYMCKWVVVVLLV
jgi:hypothetical protein